MNFEHLETVIIDIKRHVNYRPVTNIEKDNEESQVLTSNMIMRGKDCHILEETNVEENDFTKIQRRLKKPENMCGTDDRRSNYTVLWKCIALTKENHVFQS